jgi:hypothetical protein
MFSVLQAYTGYISQIYQREIRGSYSSVADDWILLGHDAHSIGE